MIKNLSILITGILIGMGAMFLIQVCQFYKDGSESSRMRTLQAETGQLPNVTPKIDYDQIYDKLMDEKKAKSEEKTWFDEELENLSADAQKKAEEMNSAGDEAAKMFEQFSTPAEEKPSKQ